MLQATTSPADDAPPVSALSPFRFPVFRSIWFASVASNLGGLIQTVGAAWLMTSIAKSTDMVALVQTSVALPIVLLSLFAGAMADSLDRRKVMLGAQVFMLVVSTALTVAARAGVPPGPLLATAARDLLRREGETQEAAIGRVGVRLVLPLGLVLLPAFMCTTVLPLVLVMTRRQLIG